MADGKTPDDPASNDRLAVKAAATNQAPQRIKKWVGGVTVVATASASVYGLFKDGRIAAFAFLGMIAAIILLVVVNHVIKLSETKNRKDLAWWNNTAKALVVFVLFYLAILLVCLFPVIYRIFAGVQPQPGPVPGPQIKTFAHLLKEVPSEHVGSLKDWINDSLWNHAYRESTTLPTEADWSFLNVKNTASFYRLSLWQDFSKDNHDKTSPVLLERTITARKTRAADTLRIIVGTDGVDVMAVCTSGQSFTVDMGYASGTSQTKHFTREAQVLVDISSYEIGEEFTVTVRAVQWNGLLRNDPWLCFMSFGTGIGKLTIEGSQNEQMWGIKWSDYPPTSDKPIDSTGVGTQVVSQGHDSVIWDNIPLQQNHTYEIDWSFDHK